MRRAPACAVLLALAVSTACRDDTSAPALVQGPELSLQEGAGCPATADFVVRSWDELRTAIATASPGDVIAVDGMFEATGFDIWTADLTITCAAAGSGLRAPWGFMFRVFAPRVTIEQLTLDAGVVGAAAYLAHQGGPDAGNAEDIRLIGNTIRCGDPDYCVVYGGFPGEPVAQGALVVGNHFTAAASANALHFHGVDDARVEGNTFLGTAANRGVRVQGGTGLVITDNVLQGSWVDPVLLEFTEGSQILGNTIACGDECLFAFGSHDVVVANNRFESSGSPTGVHLQQGTDGVRVENNEIIATAPSTVGTFGAIRLRDGANVVISGNIVRGPWANGLALADLARSRIEHNRVEGPQLYGIRARSGVSFVPLSMTDNVFRNNQISGAGSAGILLTSACRNELFGNNVQGNADDLGAVFDVPTGANVMVGNRNVVMDNGDFDCDGDGIADPNTITGPGRVKHGVAFGQADDAGVTVNGKTLH